MLSWNKKGEDEAQSDSMSSLVKIIIVALFLVFFFVVGSKLYSAFFGVDKNTMDSFNGLVDNFELMLQKPTNFEYLETTFVSDGEAVLAVLKGENPSICIYKNGEKLKSGNPWKCRTFEKAKLAIPGTIINYDRIQFLSLRATILNEQNPCDDSPGSPSVGAQQTFTHHGFSIPEEFPSDLYPLIYYDMKFPFAFCGEKVYLLYIEKYVVDKKAFLSLGENLPQATIDQRINTLSDCPSGSDEKCIGTRRNSEVIGEGGFCFYDQNKKRCEYKPSVTRCEANKDVTSDCLCGNTMIFKNSAYKYCFYRSNLGYIALPFSCGSIESCADYCKTTIRGLDSCDLNEIQYCDRNVCDGERNSEKCKTKESNKGIICAAFDPES